MLLVAGCAGRSANPVSSVRAGDEQLTCAQIDGEANEMLPVVKKLSNDADKTGYNAGITTAAILLAPPMLFALDLSDAEKVEIQAYIARYQVISSHHKRLNCPGTLPVLLDNDGKPLGPAA